MARDERLRMERSSVDRNASLVPDRRIALRAPKDRLEVPGPVYARATVSMARRGWTSPEPARRMSKPDRPLVVAVPTIAALTSRGDQSGCACSTSAATPVTAGAAMDVPDIPLAPVVVAPSADITETPGAVTSGLSALSPLRGPAELNVATDRKAGFASEDRGRTRMVRPSSLAMRPRTP